MLTGAPDDQPRRDRAVLAGPGVAVKAGEEQLCRNTAHGVGVLGHDRDTRIEHVGEIEVVEADEGDEVLQVVTMECADGPAGDEVLAREEGCGGLIGRQLQQSRGRLLCDRARVQIAEDEALVDADPGRAQSVGVALQAVTGGSDVGQVAEERDTTVPRGDEMLDSLARSRPVRGQDGVRIEETRWAVDEDDREASLDLVAQVRVIEAGRHHDESVDAPRDQGTGDLTLLDRVLVETGGHDREPAFGRGIVDGAMDRAEERIGHVLEHEAEHPWAASSSSQARGGQVGPVVQLPRGTLDPLGPFVRYPSLAVDDARDRLDADPRERRDITHGGATAHSSPPLRRWL